MNIAKLDFMALDISNKNCVSWVLDAKTYINANGLEGIKEKKKIMHLAKIRLCFFSLAATFMKV